jgi:hypothetical protein
MARLIDCLSAFVIAIYLFALWSDWFTQAELTTPAKRPSYGNQLDLTKPGPIEWIIPADKLGFAVGEAYLSLSFNLNSLWHIPLSREEVDLRCRVRAEGRLPGGDWRDRLVRNDYFRTDQPFSPGSGLWESYGAGEMDFGLAGIHVEPGEDLRITVDILSPDGRLDRGRPRLRLIARNGPGDVSIPALVRAAVRECGFWVSLGAIGWLTGRAWRSSGQPRTIE